MTSSCRRQGLLPTVRCCLLDHWEQQIAEVFELKLNYFFFKKMNLKISLVNMMAILCRREFLE